jgi:hypothetical protein
MWEASSSVDGNLESIVVPDIPRLYTAVAEWLACMVFVSLLKKRFGKRRAAALSAGFLGALCAFQLLAGMFPLYLWIPGMILSILIMHVFIFSACKNRFLDTLYWTARAFVLAEFMASLEWQFYYYITENYAAARDSRFIEAAFLILVYAAVFAAVFFLERRYVKTNDLLKPFNKDLVATAGVAAIIFLISNVSFISRNTPLSGQYAGEIFYIRTLVDLCGVILFYALQEQRHSMRSKQELNAVQNIMEKQYSRYCQSKDNIELLNRRYHDLKHQIVAIRSESDLSKWDAYLGDIHTSIKKYEAENKTGNKVLDTILAAKTLYCIDNGINFTCVADGALLNCIDVMDICSIFGNALDNAIEAVKGIRIAEKRLIKLALYRQNNFVMVRIENYIADDPIVFEGGMPVTTKNKRENHGYGMKSIKRSAEKYDGVVTVNVIDNWFNLCILFPSERLSAIHNAINANNAGIAR